MSDRLRVPARPLPVTRAFPGASAAPDAFIWPAAVCAAFVLAQLVLAVPGSGLGWDETVYTSQVAAHVPAAFFSAPRARGISLLAAPVAGLTSSTAALRVYLAVLSGAGLLVALRVWRPLLPARVLALAGGLFAGLWITLLYGSQVMPNLWSAYGALAAVGCLLRAARDRTDRAALAGLAAAVALVGLMRPPDAVWLVLPLAGAALSVHRWRRPALFAVLAAGLLAGCAEWVVEAYARYGGPAARLHRASVIEGGLGLHFAVDDQVRALDGRTLCRPCDVPWRHRANSAWWFALPLLAAGGAAAAWRGRRAAVWLPLVTAGFLAAPYLFSVGYAAPRFLLPAYALLAIPVAECLWWLVRDGAGRLRPTATAVVALALCGHLAIQGGVLAGAVGNNRQARGDYDAMAAGLRSNGVRPPCLLSGDSAVPLAFYAGCASRETAGADRSITVGGLRAAARHQPVAVLVAGGGPVPAFARHWRSAALPVPSGSAAYRAYFPR
ncbi:hypothetical protein NMG29_30255 [Streptomyces cocklensis]|jgi:hypothetical protein|uniref:Integral membrane protein n=1 Tax=Actinacidiphila cocklensis TaxID=887465 RepID=A0A9W4GQX4_9ACTN|nr:hypothetical protein [Actinacidiphila cocklensis]MDD1062455.1 hypothetical protein [Actinacidiphila cocklensis]WSX72528.1 hypothetical protein OH826_00785 [Streptomyces sp. NBC_00899]WSX81403.1 hypothetical protein OH826_50710 [Streptomyces sp. NBC_00899]CAG6392021.1 conserved membrane hypothetical protein [Actinacidiphila cocklensis]